MINIFYSEKKNDILQKNHESVIIRKRRKLLLEIKLIIYTTKQFSKVEEIDVTIDKHIQIYLGYMCTHVYVSDTET